MADSDSGKSVSVPLPDYVRDAAREAAWTVIKEHKETCPIKKIDDRMRVLEGRFNILLGAILGSGVLGGAVGALVGKLLGV